MNNTGLLVVFSGPSGVGKDTVLQRLLQRCPQVRLSVSATTRSPRAGEEDGKDYFFLDHEVFEEQIRQGKMLEYAEYCGNYYGTPSVPVETWMSEGNDVILEIVVQGGTQVQQKRKDCVSIFLLPPSMKVLENRLRGRGTEAEETIQKRMKAAREEVGKAFQYDYAVVNDDLEETVTTIIQILESEKFRVSRNKDFLERMLEIC